MSRLFSKINTTNILSSANNIAIVNQSNQIASLTSDLNQKYINNNGCLIKIFTYSNDATNNVYLEFFNDYIDILFQIYNKQNVTINRELSLDLSSSALILSSTIDKSTFNNINILLNFVETIGTLDTTEIKNIYETGINKDTQGNYPSLFISLLPDQIERILQNKIVQSYYQNRIPILLPYGEITPYILYNKYIYDKTTEFNRNRTIESYILNMGPCNLDYISAMFNFHRLNKIYQNYINDQLEFDKRFEITEYDNKYGLNLKYGVGNPNNLKFIKESNNNTEYLKNFKIGPKEYNLDLSNEYVFYIGINNDYGWNNPIEFIKSFSNSYNIYEFDEYDINTEIDINFRKSNSNLSEISYNNFIQDIINNFDNFIENNLDDRLKSFSNNNNIKNDEIEYYLDIFKNNPKVYAIKVPLYQTAQEYSNNTIGLGVLDAWNLINSIIMNKNLDISNCSIFIQCYGKMCDYTTLNYLYNNSQYINLTYGSAYDFIEKNFVNLSNNIESFDKLKFDGLYSVKPYNAFAPNYFSLLNNTIIKFKNQIELNDIFKNLDDSIDQFKFLETLILINKIGLINLNVVLKNGLQSNTESLALNYKIPTGYDFFMNNNNGSFNFSEIFNSQSANASTGIADQKLLFQNLIGHFYNDGLYTTSNNGYPFIRNNSFSLYQRTYDQLSINNENITIKYKYHPVYHNTYLFYPNFIQSHSYLINSLIFKLNNDQVNENIEINKFFDEFFNYGLIKTIDNNYYTVKLNPLDEQRPFYLNSYMWNNASERNIKELLIGNNFRETQTFNIDYCDTLEKLTIGKNILEIPSEFCQNRINLYYVNFLIDSSLSIIRDNAFNNCSLLNNLILPNSLIRIENNSFANTSNLSNLQLSDNLIYILDNAFINSGITNLNFNKIQYLGYSTFKNCSNLTNIMFNNLCTITTINNETFRDCINLTNINLSLSINNLNEMSFKNCKNLSDISFHSNVNFIGYECFAECESLQKINLNNTTITSISDRTFANCISLKHCIFPETLINFGDEVFDGCIDLSYIIIQGKIESLISSNIFANIPHNVIIYYYSNLTPTNYFDNIPNKILVDLYNNLPNYISYNYYPIINIEKENELILKPFYLEFYIEDFKLNIEYSYSETGNFTDTSLIGNYNKIYNILYLNNLQFNLVTNINVFDKLVNLQILNVLGNNNLYYNSPSTLTLLNIKNLYIDYGYISKDYNGLNIDVNIINELDDITLENYETFDTTGKIYKIKYYSIDGSYNYKSYIKNIYFYSEGIVRKNIKIFKEKSRFEIIQENDITKGKLYFTLLNDGNYSFDSVLRLKSSNTTIPELNSYKFLFPIFSILDPDSGTQGSVDLTSINGPEINTVFNYDGNDHVFTNRLDNKILNGSTLKILNSYSQYNIVFKEINNLSNFKYEQSWGLTKGLKKNEYIDFELTFNYFGTCDDMILGKNNIFTKNNSFGIFSDNGTSTNISGGFLQFYDKGYFNEVNIDQNEGLDTFDGINNDNVYKFTIDHNNAILNGPKNIYIENGMFYKDFGALSLIYNYPNTDLSYIKFPENTYNSSEISMNYGIYEISYAIFPQNFYPQDGDTFESLRQSNDYNNNDIYIVELSRNINIINYNNPNKPNIFVGDGLEQNILLGNHSVNNNNNYALSYNGKVLPLYKEIRIDNYDICGTFYEYFYSYDDSGNYNSVKRTINVTNDEFSSIEFKPLFGFENYNNNFVIRLENKGTIDYNLISNNTFIDFKIVSVENTSVFTNSFDFNNKTYYFDPNDENKFSLLNNNIIINSNTTENITYTINNSQLNLNGIIKSNSYITIVIENIRFNLRPILAVLNNLLIENNSLNISLYEENTPLISLQRSSIFDIINNNFTLKIKNNSNSNYNTLIQNPINLYFYKIYKGITYNTEYFNNIQFNSNKYYYIKNLDDEFFMYSLDSTVISINSDISYSIINNCLTLIGEISNNTEISIDISNLTKTNFTVGVFLNNDINLIFSESPCIFIYESNTNLVANKSDILNNFTIQLSSLTNTRIDITNMSFNINGNNLLQNFALNNYWNVNGSYNNNENENLIYFENTNSSINKNLNYNFEIDNINLLCDFSFTFIPYIELTITNISGGDIAINNIELIINNNNLFENHFNDTINNLNSSTFWDTKTNSFYGDANSQNELVFSGINSTVTKYFTNITNNDLINNINLNINSRHVIGNNETNLKILLRQWTNTGAIFFEHIINFNEDLEIDRFTLQNYKMYNSENVLHNYYDSLDRNFINFTLSITNNYYTKEIINENIYYSNNINLNLRNNICLTNYIPQDKLFYIYFKNNGLVPTNTQQWIGFTIFELTEDINLSNPQFNNFSFFNNNKNYYFKGTYTPLSSNNEFILANITSTLYNDNFGYWFYPITLNPNNEIYFKLNEIELNSNSIYAFILDHGYNPEYFIQNHGYIFETIELWDNNSDNIVVVYT